MRIVARRLRELPQIRTIRPYREDVKITVGQPAEEDPVPLRPRREVVVRRGQRADGTVRQAHDPETLRSVSPGSIDDSVTVWRPAREPRVARALCPGFSFRTVGLYH